MIDYLQIQNFKSLKDISLPLGKLNLFFGLNGMGKSSTIQSLLLMRQSYWQNSAHDFEQLHINGSLVSLGTVRDILCQNADDEKIRFYLQHDHGSRLDLTYECAEKLRTGNILKRSYHDINESYPSALCSAENFFYLGAEHIGPRLSYRTSEWNPLGPDYLGSDGRYAVPFLAIHGDTKVAPYLCLPEAQTDSLMDQVSAWMDRISPGVKLNAILDPVEESAKLLIRYRGSRLDTTDILPVNVGFGIPYVLPVITELLISGDKSLILLENPESHLHPRGQANIAELIARAASGGAQIICESHSDHIINGIRVAVKEGLIDHRNVLVSYFDRDEDLDTQVHHLELDAKGEMSSYPDGFLDEWGILMSELL